MSIPSRDQAKAVFKAIAGDDGKITPVELRDAMAGKGYDVAKIFVDIDKNGDMVITEEEFLEEVLKEPRTKCLGELFDKIDTNHSGDVSYDEVKQFLDSSSEGKQLIADTEKMKKDFEAMDIDGSYSISKDEFTNFMNAHY